MLQRFALWIGGLVERIIAQFGGPVEVPPEEMEQARREMEERVAMDAAKREADETEQR